MPAFLSGQLDWIWFLAGLAFLFVATLLGLIPSQTFLI